MSLKRARFQRLRGAEHTPPCGETQEFTPTLKAILCFCFLISYLRKIHLEL